jgi:glutathione S-transferase
MAISSATPLVLYGDSFWTSPFVFSCYVALAEKGVPFEVAEVSLADREQHRPEYRDATLTGKVPALREGEFWLAESMAILDYLEERFPAPQHPRILPGDLHQRARARQVLSWLGTGLGALREDRPSTCIFYQRTDRPLSPAGAQAAERLVRVASALIREGATTLFDSFTVADADLAFMLERLIANGDEVPAHLRAFAEAQWRRPSVRSFVEHPRRAYRAY